MQAGKPGAGASPAAEDSIDWGVLEKMFLGEGWDDEIKELAAKVFELEIYRIGDPEGSWELEISMRNWIGTEHKIGCFTGISSSLLQIKTAFAFLLPPKIYVELA